MLVSAAVPGRSHDTVFVRFLLVSQWSWPRTAVGDESVSPVLQLLQREAGSSLHRFLRSLDTCLITCMAQCAEETRSPARSQFMVPTLGQVALII